MEWMVLGGVGIHALGGISAATCYISQKGARQWSWQSYWIVVCLTAWFAMPLVVALITAPHLGQVLSETPDDVKLKVFGLGALYGFGGMAFAVSIRYIGFSLTYAIAIGISAVFGTVVPRLLDGNLVGNFQKPGGLFALTGFVVSILGVAICGSAGFMKEKELVGQENNQSPGQKFDMKTGLVLVILAGVLSGVFGVGVESGDPIDKLAIRHGARQDMAGYPKYIILTGGTLLTNLVWWGIVVWRQRTAREFIRVEGGNGGTLLFHYLMGIIAGVLWFVQFIFYEQGHVRMGEFKFVSWGIHMAMLIFFSFGVGLIFREWNACTRKTLAVLLIGLMVLIGSFGLVTYGAAVGEAAKNTPTNNTNTAETNTGACHETLRNDLSRPA